MSPVSKRQRRGEVDPVLGEESDHFVYVQYDMHCEGGEICAGQENESYPNREPEHKSHELLGVFTEDRDQPHYTNYSERINVDFDPKGRSNAGGAVHLVLVTYQTGDTFGYSTGNVSIVGVYVLSEEAEEIARSIRAGTYKGYCAWDGYFEHFEGVEVTRHVLNEQEGVRRF